MAGAVQRRWLDHATTILLENVRPKESLWNVKVEAYGNKSKKKTDIEELLEEVAATSATPQGVDTKAVKESKHEILLRLLNKRVISKEQWELLFPPDGSAPDVERCDVKLLVVLLHNVCGLEKPINGWNVMPSPSDTSLEANLAQLMAYRDVVLALVSSNAVNFIIFGLYWDSIESVLMSLGMSKVEVDSLKDAPLDDENKFHEFLLQWQAETKDFEECFQDVETQQYKQKEEIKPIQETVMRIQNVIVNDGPIKTIGNIKFDTSEGNIIGTGGKGTVVYRGTLTGKEVAIKKVFTRMFDMVEVNKLKKLQHPHIIRCYYTTKLDEFMYLALELCNKTLAQCVKENLFATAELQLDQLSCLLQVAEALRYLHVDMKVCHRDIKPENILVIFNDEFGKQRFVLADFNTARDVRNESFSTNKSTTGTNGWIAREMYHPGERRTFKVDVFSFGCVCFYTLTNGKHPFGDISDQMECQKNINTGVQATRLFCLDNSLAHNKLGDLVFAMTQKNPDSRPTAAEMCAEFKDVLADTASQVNVSLGDKRRPLHPIELCFKTTCRTSILQTGDFRKFEEYFAQCRSRFLERQIGVLGDKEKSFQTRFKLLLLEVLYRARTRKVRPARVIQNPKHYGIDSFYQRNYLGEEYPEKEVKTALTQKIKKFDEELDDHRLKQEYVITLEKAMNFLFYELTVQKKNI